MDRVVAWNDKRKTENGKRRRRRTMRLSAIFRFSLFVAVYFIRPPPSRKTAGADARVGREPGQVRKEAALSGPGSVPSSLRSSSARRRRFQRQCASGQCRRLCCPFHICNYDLPSMKLFIVANPNKPNVSRRWTSGSPWMKQRAEVVGVDTDCCSRPLAGRGRRRSSSSAATGRCCPPRGGCAAGRSRSWA